MAKYVGRYELLPLGHTTITAYINLCNKLLPTHLQVQKLTAHGMRGSLATNAYKAGASLAEVNALMQHRSLQTTVEYMRPNEELYLASGTALARSFQKKQLTHIAGVQVDRTETIKNTNNSTVTTYSAKSSSRTASNQEDEQERPEYCPATGNSLEQTYEVLWCGATGGKLEQWELSEANSKK